MLFRQGLLFVVSGPSGTGKGTLLKRLKEMNGNVRFSISATTREPRKGEVDGTNYFYKTKDQFRHMIEKGELVEWDEYCGNYYGTPRAYIEKTLEQGFDVVLEITVEGAANVKRKYEGCISIFVMPPSFTELEKRITARGTEDSETIKARLMQSVSELSRIEGYDYVVINDDLGKAADDINAIMHAEKLKVSRNPRVLDELGFTK